MRYYKFNLINTRSTRCYEIYKKINMLKRNATIEKKKLVYINRLRLYNYFLQTKTDPTWITIKYLPVIPPNLRPIVKLKDKTTITTDLNILYGNIISSNNKLLKLRKMHVPEKFLNSEKFVLQTKVDQLIDNNKVNKNELITRKTCIKIY